MNTFRLFWTLHKWTGVTVALVVVVSASSGFLLLLKKEFAWIQPPTRSGASGPLASFLSVDRLFQVIEDQQHPCFRQQDDVDRVDLRPDAFVFKVRSVHEHAEIQVCATTGRILSTGTRRSDWFESIHDGSWVGKPFHDWVMPLVALALLFLVFSGLWLWLEPVVKRARRRARDRRQGS